MGVPQQAGMRSRFASKPVPVGNVTGHHLAARQIDGLVEHSFLVDLRNESPSQRLSVEAHRHQNQHESKDVNRDVYHDRLAHPAYARTFEIGLHAPFRWAEFEQERELTVCKQSQGHTPRS